MKKIGVIIFSVVALIAYLQLDRLTPSFQEKILGIEVLPMEEINMLCEGKEDAFLEPQITLNGGETAYDGEQNMLLIPQSLEEEEFTGKLQVKEGQLYFAADETLGSKADVISQNKVMRLFWITDMQCWMYNVYFTGMPVAEIVGGEYNEQGIAEGELWIFDPYRENNEFQDADCSWHIRGATTRSYEKSSYKVSLKDEKLSFLGMRKDDDWILHALYDDEGLIHNKLSYALWQKIAADNSVKNDEGIHMEYLELFINGRYVGVYGLSERIDKKALSLNDKDILYKCRDQNNPAEDDFYTELTEEMNPTFELKYPKDFKMEDWEPLRQWTDMYCFDGFTDYESGTAILNMENAVDYNLFNLLICGMDNIMKNIYFWADCQQDGSYQMIKIPWDLNMTWGNSWIDDYNCNFNRYQEKNLENADGWTPDLYKLYEENPEEIGKLLSRRWRELRENIITKENLKDMADEEFAYLYDSGAYIRNEQRWPPKGDYWSDEYLYEYIDRKIDFLDEYIGQME